MALPESLDDVEAHLVKQVARQVVELLPMLQRARRVIGEFQPGPHHRRHEVE